MTTWHIVRHADKENGDFYNPKLDILDEKIDTVAELRTRWQEIKNTEKSACNKPEKN